jgi:hypothetical protein
MKIDLSQFAEEQKEPDFIIAFGLNEYAQKILKVFPCREGLEGVMEALVEEAQRNGLLLHSPPRGPELKDKEGLMAALVAQLENSYTVKVMKLRDLGKKIRRDLVQELSERLGAPGVADGC